MSTIFNSLYSHRHKYVTTCISPYKAKVLNGSNSPNILVLPLPHLFQRSGSLCKPRYLATVEGKRSVIYICTLHAIYVILLPGM